MALDWSIEDCKDSEELKVYNDEGRWRLEPITEALVWACMGVDLHGITKVNLVEFCARLKLLQDIGGGLLIDNETGKPVCINSEMVHRRIGLRTNVANKPWSAFSRKIHERLVRQVEDEFAKMLGRELEEATKKEQS